MELGLSLGDASNNTLGFLKDNSSAASNLQQDSGKKTGLDFFMSLGLNSANQEQGKAQKSHEDDDEDDEDEDDGDDDGSDDGDGETPVQLNLLPLAPVPRRISSSHLLSLPWSSDNGSSENGSSENTRVPAKGLDVNRVPAAEEASTANSVDFARNSSGHLQLSGSKRDLEGGEAERASSRASDDDDNGLNTRKKLRLSKEQSAFLEESFKEHNTLNPKQKLALAKQLNLRPRQVEVWFQNRRARTKLKQTEVDCEYLKRCCETLTEENRRLHKELQELRALKTSNPYYMQLPATTLTMCPSCERVATAAPPTAAAVDPIPFPLTRPRFYPFAQAPTHPNQPAAS